MQFLSKNFFMAVTLSVRSSQLLCCKIFVLKYVCRTSTLRKFFNTKIFPMKISYNENFPIYGSTQYQDSLHVDYGILWCTMIHVHVYAVCCGILWYAVIYCGILWYTVVYCETYLWVWQYQSEHSRGSSKQHHNMSTPNLLYADLRQHRAHTNVCLTLCLETTEITMLFYTLLKVIVFSVKHRTCTLFPNAN